MSNHVSSMFQAIYHVENTSTLPPEKIRLELECVLNRLVLADILSSFTMPDRFAILTL